MQPRWLKVDPHRAQISDEFMNWCEERGIEVVDSTGKAEEQQGKVEHHAQLFELMLEDVLADVQPQTEYEWGECRDALQEAKNSLLSVSGVSPMQLVFGRNPEIPGDLLSDNPDLIANSSLLHDRGAGQAARVRTVARTKLILHSDKRRALDTRPRGGTDVPSRRLGCSVAHDEGIPGKRAHHRWSMHGRSARQLLDCPPWKRHQGVSGTTEACGTERERHAWRLAEAELRTKLVNFDEFFGHRFEEITGGERPPSKEEDPVEEEAVREPLSEHQETDPTGGRRITGKPQLLVTIRTGCTIKIRRCRVVMASVHVWKRVGFWRNDRRFRERGSRSETLGDRSSNSSATSSVWRNCVSSWPSCSSRDILRSCA